MSDNICNEWVNLDKVKYFNIMDFVSNIQLSDNLLFHLEETGEKFEEYIKTLTKYCDYDDYAILFYWLDQALKEMKLSAELENHKFKNVDLFNSDLFFDKLSISHERIKHIHKYVCEKTNTNVSNSGEYRKGNVDVGANYKDGYQVYWYAPEPCDVKKFMDDYLNFYRINSLRSEYSNPFLKSALAHLLFVRIHPFTDGNGRTARIIQNIAFTSGINKIYNTKLKLSPLNISQNILINRYSYADRINKIHFDLDYDNNKAINNWFEFILNMYDEQLFFQLQRIPNFKNALDNVRMMKDSQDELSNAVKKFNLKPIKK